MLPLLVMIFVKVGKSKTWFLRNERNLFELSPENALESRRERVNLSIFREGMPPTIPQQSAEL